MDALIDFWFLHRETLLKGAGIAMFAAAGAAMVFAGAPAAHFVRNLVLPLAGVAVVAYAVRRWYWYDEDASLLALSPESAAVAGAIALAAVVIAGLPGGGESDDRALVEAAITRTFMTSDPALCDEAYTQAFIDQTHFGTGVVAQGDCRRDEAEPNPPGTDPDGVSISDLAMGASQASATVTVSGGALDRSTVRVELVVDDGAWKLDRMVDVDLDRAAFDDAMVARAREAGISAEEARCTLARYHRKVKMAQLEQAMVDGGEAPDPDWGLGCYTTRTLRSMLIDRSRQSARERGLPDAVVDCLVDGLRELPSPRLRAVLKKDDEATTAGLMQQVMGPCLAAAQSTDAA